MPGAHCHVAVAAPSGPLARIAAPDGQLTHHLSGRPGLDKPGSAHVPFWGSERGE